MKVHVFGRYFAETQTTISHGELFFTHTESLIHKHFHEPVHFYVKPLHMEDYLGASIVQNFITEIFRARCNHTHRMFITARHCQKLFFSLYYTHSLFDVAKRTRSSAATLLVNRVRRLRSMTTPTARFLAASLLLALATAIAVSDHGNAMVTTRLTSAAEASTQIQPPRRQEMLGLEEPLTEDDRYVVNDTIAMV